MPENVSQENETKRVPLPSPFKPSFMPAPRGTKPVKADERYMIDLKVKVDGLSAVPDESNKIDLVKLIQTYKDQCGMEMARKLIKIGQVPPDAFADDGKHSFDCSNVPSTPQDVANALVRANNNVDAMRKEFNIPVGDINGEQLEAILNAYFSKHPEFIQQPKKEGE